MQNGSLLVRLVKLMRRNGAYLHIVRVIRLLTVGYPNSSNLKAEQKEWLPHLVVHFNNSMTKMHKLVAVLSVIIKKKCEAFNSMAKTKRKAKLKAKKQQNNELKKQFIEYKTRYEREKDKKLKIYRYINYIELSIFYGLEKFSAI